MVLLFLSLPLPLFTSQVLSETPLLLCLFRLTFTIWSIAPFETSMFCVLVNSKSWKLRRVVHIPGGSETQPDLGTTAPYGIRIKYLLCYKACKTTGACLLARSQPHLLAVSTPYFVIQQHWTTYNLLNAISHLRLCSWCYLCLEHLSSLFTLLILIHLSKSSSGVTSCFFQDGLGISFCCTFLLG